MPDDYRPIDVEHAPLCSVCGKPMIAGQVDRHETCAPPALF
jgi:hypothetical protein